MAGTADNPRTRITFSGGHSIVIDRSIGGVIADVDAVDGVKGAGWLCVAAEGVAMNVRTAHIATIAEE